MIGHTNSLDINTQADWNEEITSSDSYIKNKPTFITGGSQTTTSTEDGGTNVYTFTKSDGTTSTLSVKNGSKGSTTAVATTSANGLMSSTDKSKLDGIATGATANTGTITGVSANGTSVATSGVANIPAASTSAYGVTKLSSSTSSTSTTLAATPSAVRSAYNLAYGKADKITVSNETATSKSISPNIFYLWELMSYLNITLATPSSTSVYNEYMFQFSSGSTATLLSLPSSVVIANEVSIEANKTYQVSILNNIGIIISS